MSSQYVKAILETSRWRFGPPPTEYVYGDDLDWSSALVETELFVELPFWMMVSAGSVDVAWEGHSFRVELCAPWIEVFGAEFTDSRVSCGYNGPRPDSGAPIPIEDFLASISRPSLRRHCKTVLKLVAKAHEDAFRELDEDDSPILRDRQMGYWASLCEAHIPVVNEVIRRYRLVSYDRFAFEVDSWDVPVWYLKQAGKGYRAVLHPYKMFDAKPVMIEPGQRAGEPDQVHEFEWATLGDMSAMDSSTATPGEFELLDARSLLERGDYAGSVRRVATAIEVEVAWALLKELEKTYPPAKARDRLSRTDNDFPGRLRQWRKLAKPSITEFLFEELERTRTLRHQIVHEGLRLTQADRGRAARALDTARWLFNQIEGKPDRTFLREHGALKSAGSVDMTIRFPAVLGHDGIVLRPIGLVSSGTSERKAARKLHGRAARLASSGDLAGAIAAGEKLWSEFSGSADLSTRRTVADGLWQLAEHYEQAGDLAAAIEVAQRLATAFGGADDEELKLGVASGLTDMAVHLAKSGLSAEAIATGEQVWDLFRSEPGLRLRRTLAASSRNRALHLGASGRLSEAIAVGELVQAEFGSDEDSIIRVQVAMATKELSYNYILSGDLEKAEEACARLFTPLDPGDVAIRVAACKSLYNLALAHAGRGDLSVASERATRLREIFSGDVAPEITAAVSAISQTLDHWRRPDGGETAGD
jgi:tetratricopeptide (TPR) repeat protein